MTSRILTGHVAQVRGYFDQIDWMHNLLDRETFEAEHDAYWDMLAQNRGVDIDPAWLALYSTVLSISCDYIEITQGTVDLDRSMAATWSAASTRLMDLSDWQGRPQIRNIWSVSTPKPWVGPRQSLMLIHVVITG